MIPDVSQALAWLEKNPHALTGILRGVERETLRITTEGQLATDSHPKALGAASTHPWITTDFAEAMLEFITPAGSNLEQTMETLRDIHRHVARHLGDQRMWPLSMPCCINDEQDIRLAEYGTSNKARLKTLYREGLKNRYGALMQVISGVHYNFSLPLAFWQEKEGVKDEQSGKEIISAGYFRLIRNYYRFGWVIPYLFGASPVICESFIRGREVSVALEELGNGMYYMPYATSLRMSDLGYTNKSQSNLGITFNNLQMYTQALRRATQTPAEEFVKIGVKVDGRYRQLNANVLQVENELYAPIRPKRVVLPGESPTDALLRGGIQYVEVRALDVNPFAVTGIDLTQTRFLDLFLIWCALADAPEMSSEELLCTRDNWNRVILEGRKPGQVIGVGCDSNRQSLELVGKQLFNDLRTVAKVLDTHNQQSDYVRVCDELVPAFTDPDLTLSARTLAAVKEQGMNEFGLSLAEQYHQTLSAEPLTVLKEDAFSAETLTSVARQSELEKKDTQNFEEYLSQMKRYVL